MGVRERREREKELRRTLIVNAARSAFLSHGFEQTTMDKIAEEAEVSKGTLYLYYQNRDELLIAVVLEDVEKIADMLEQLSNKKMPADKKLARAAQLFFQFAENNELFFKATSHLDLPRIISLQAGTNPTCAQEFIQLHTRIFSIIGSMVHEGIESGIFSKTTNVQLAIASLMIALKGSHIVCKSGVHPPLPGNVKSKDVLRNITTLLIKGMST